MKRHSVIILSLFVAAKAFAAEADAGASAYALQVGGHSVDLTEKNLTELFEIANNIRSGEDVVSAANKKLAEQLADDFSKGNYKQAKEFVIQLQKHGSAGDGVAIAKLVGEIDLDKLFATLNVKIDDDTSKKINRNRTALGGLCGFVCAGAVSAGCFATGYDQVGNSFAVTAGASGIYGLKEILKKYGIIGTVVSKELTTVYETLLAHRKIRSAQITQDSASK